MAQRIKIRRGMVQKKMRDFMKNTCLKETMKNMVKIENPFTGEMLVQLTKQTFKEKMAFYWFDSGSSHGRNSPGIINSLGLQEVS